jgi:hypothetical protein
MRDRTCAPLAAGEFPDFGPPVHVVPIYVFGDSHALCYSNLTFTERVTGATLATRVKYIPGFNGPSFWAGGGLHQELTAALEAEGLVRHGRVVPFSRDRNDLAAARAAGRPLTVPLILITCGDIDVRGGLLPMLRDQRDFIPPYEGPYPPSGRPLLPFDFCQRLLEAHMNQLLDGVTKLWSMGLTCTYLQGIVPPTCNEAAFRTLHGYDCPVTTRYKAAKLFNDYLAEGCLRRGIPFLDVWPDTTSGGYLRPELEFDGVHLPPEAAQIALRLLVDHTMNNAWRATNYARHRIYYETCCGIDPASQPPLQEEVVPASSASPSPDVLAGSAGPEVPTPVVTRTASPAAILKQLVRRFVPTAVRRAVRKTQQRWRRPEAAPAAPPPAPAPVPTPPPPPARVEVPNVPPAICTSLAPVDANLPEVPWLRIAVNRFRNEGICRLELDRGTVERWAAALDFSLDFGNHQPRFDWAGPTLRDRSDVLSTAVPPEVLLRDLFDLFTRDDMEQFLQACLGCQGKILNCRPVRSVPHRGTCIGPQSWHGDGCPDGIIRGIIYLNDVDEEGGPFEYKDSSGAVRSVTGSAGTFLVFDANRLIHRGSPPAVRERSVIDLVIQARLPKEPFSILWSGRKPWPQDPFSYSTEGMITFPVRGRAA